MILSSGPLQGLTDDIFRYHHQQIWGGIDDYYGPYIRIEPGKETKKSQIRDSQSELNKNIHYIPQILANDAALMRIEIQKLFDLGYQEVNWNLGCPYPMVTKRKMGAGLMPYIELIDSILENLMADTPTDFTIKCRFGLLTHTEIEALIPIFNRYPIKKLIVHARTGKQMYKGSAQADKILPLIEKSKIPITYNGDIKSLKDMEDLKKLFKDDIKDFMIGRGLLMKPFLAEQIKGRLEDEKLIKEKMQTFHQALYDAYKQKLHSSHLLMKMRSFWEYFAASFEQSHKTFKRIKKSKNTIDYEKAVSTIFTENHINID